MEENSQLEYLKHLKNTHKNFEYYVHPWKDRFSEQRNHYLEKLREMNYNGWVICSDTDEHFPEETLKQLRTLIKESENGTRYTGVKFQVIDISVDDDDRNKVLSRTKNEYWKSLMFKYHPDLRYEGEPHETLAGFKIKWINSQLNYEHARSNLHVLQRATENYFISNSNRYSERWAEFRFLCTKNNILNFKEYWNLFEKHELPKEVEEWMYNHKNDNFDSGDSELREMYQLYEDVLPKRSKQKLENKKEGISSTAKLLSDIIDSKFTEGLGKEMHKKIPEIIDALTPSKKLQKHDEVKKDNKEELIYEHLSIGECLIISITKSNALVASNNNGNITFSQVPIPNEDSNSYLKLTEAEQNTIRKMRFGVS